MNKTTLLTAVALSGLFLTAAIAITAGEGIFLWFLPGLSLMLLAAVYTIRAISEYRDVFGAMGWLRTAVLLLCWLVLVGYLVSGIIGWLDIMSGGPF